MSRRRSVSLALALSLALMLSFAGLCHGQLKKGFYVGKCKKTPFFGGLFGPTSSPSGDVDVEKSVADLVKAAMANNKIDAAALLRMQFHDCFVQGCDASILINGTDSEKSADANFSVRGYEFIESVKAFFEGKCKKVVSCADIIVMATKEAVFLGSKAKVKYDVRTGRRDGLVSRKNNVNLPSSTIKVDDSIKAFKAKGFTPEEMVYLLGAHTVGVTHCNFVQGRLYNFNNVAGTSDPKMDGNLWRNLTKTCPRDPPNDGKAVFLDQDTPNLVDNRFFGQLKAGRGILQIDQDLASHVNTTNSVHRLATGVDDFAALFGKAMVKLGEVGVRTALGDGEIRRVCGSVNGFFG